MIAEALQQPGDKSPAVARERRPSVDVYIYLLFTYIYFYLISRLYYFRYQ